MYHKSIRGGTEALLICLSNKRPNQTSIIVTSQEPKLNREEGRHERTYQSAGEDLVVRGAHLSSQIVCGDATGGGGFLPVVHLVMETVQIKCRAPASGHTKDVTVLVAGHTTSGMNCVAEGLVLLTAVTITDVSPSWNGR